MADKEWPLDTGSQQDNISKLHTAILKLFNFTAQFRDQEPHCHENKAGHDGLGLHATDTLLQWFISFVLLFYAILIVTIWHNVIRFLIGQKRYKYLHIAYFYLLTAVVCILRIFWFCLILTVTIK